MDFHLPGMNGIEAFKMLRADPATSSIPIIAVTASAMTEDRQKIIAAGFDGLQTKPINVKEFLEAVAADAEETRGGRRERRPEKILVVDDTPLNVKMLADILTFKGYQVVTAAGGREGWPEVAADHPDMVLLDVMMPGMNGYEVCRAIRANPATACCRW